MAKRSEKEKERRKTKPNLWKIKMGKIRDEERAAWKRKAVKDIRRVVLRPTVLATTAARPLRPTPKPAAPTSALSAPSALSSAVFESFGEGGAWKSLESIRCEERWRIKDKEVGERREKERRKKKSKDKKKLKSVVVVPHPPLRMKPTEEEEVMDCHEVDYNDLLEV